MADVKLTIDISDVTRGLETVSGDTKKVQQEAKKIGDAYKEAATSGMKGLGELRRELKELQQIPLETLTKEQAREIKGYIGEVSQEIRLYKKEVMGLSRDGFPTFINGLRGVAAIGQVATASISAFGIENEKLQKTMVQLIGVSQALATVNEMYERQTLKNAAAQLKDMSAKAASTVATKVLTATTAGATVAQKALNLAMLAMPVVAIGAGIAAIAVAFVKMSSESKKAEKYFQEWAKNAREHLENLIKFTEELKKSNLEYATIVRDFNERNLSAGEKYINRELEKIALAKESIKWTLEQVKAQKAYIEGQIRVAESQYEIMKSLNPSQAAEILKTIDTLTDKMNVYSKSIDNAEKNMLVMDGAMKQLIETRGKEIDKINQQTKAEEDAKKARDKAIADQIKAAEDLDKWQKKRIKEIEDSLKTELELLKEKYEEEKIIMSNNQQGLLLLEEDYQRKRQEIIEKEGAKEKAEAEKRAADLVKWQQERIKSINDSFKPELQLLAEKYEEEKELMKNNQEGLLALEKEYNREKAELILKAKADELKMEKQAAAELEKLWGEFKVETVRNAIQIITNLQNNQLQELKNNAKAETDALDEEYEKRIASAGRSALERRKIDEWYATSKRQIEDETGKQVAEMERKHKRQQQQIAITQATIQAAQQIMNIWAQPYAAVPVAGQAWATTMTALIGGIALTQIGAIASQKFEKGGTGIIGGRSHVSGGTPFFGGEAEKNERWAIFSKDATSRNTGLETMINAVNSNRLTINKELMTNLLSGNKMTASGNIIIAKFDGAEDLRGMHSIMKQQADSRQYSGNITTKGIITTKYLN